MGNKFWTGMTIGFITGILLAPEKGEHLRKKLAQAADNICDDFNSLVGRKKVRLEDLRNYLEQDIEGLSEEVRDRLYTILAEVEELAYSPNNDVQSSG